MGHLMRPVRNLGVLLLACALTGVAAAHDLWILPHTFRPTPEQEVPVALRVGDPASNEGVPRKVERIVRFAALAPDGQWRNIAGEAGDEPAGRLRVEAPGTYLLIHENTPASIALAPAEFEKYLEDVGLDSIRDLRARRGDDEARTAEQYSRCAKAIVRVGSDDAAGFDRRTGLMLELTPLRSPMALRASDALPVALEFDGKPLARALVRALPLPEDGTASAPTSGPAALSARTDENGSVAFVLGSARRWMIVAVHMTPADKGSGADWRSYWASLTFERDAR